MNDFQLVGEIKALRHSLEYFRNLGRAKRTPPREGFVQRFPFQKLHGDAGHAVIGLAGFRKGDEVGVMNAARGSRLIYVEAALRRHDEVNSPLRRDASRSQNHPAVCGSEP